MPERTYIYTATVATLIASIIAAHKAYNRRTPIHSPAIRILLLIALIAQTAFLHTRGLTHGHCPTTNPFETLAFLNWASLLTYQLIGTPFRHSGIGLMTAPLATLTNLLSLLSPIDYPTEYRLHGWLIEFHIATTLIALGILGLAAMAALLYIIQQHILKHHLLSPWLYSLPSIESLSTTQRRLQLIGTLTLLLALVAGITHLIYIASPPNHSFTTHILFTLLFTLHLLSSHFQWLSAKTLAISLILTYAFSLASLKWLQGFSTGL
jgi:ABC-type uncharacterized transport system permease subunit